MFRRAAGAILLAGVLFVSTGTRLDIRWTDFTCPAGTVERPVSLMDGPVECVRANSPTYDRVAFGWRERFVGIYTLGSRARILDADLLQDNWHGPALLPDLR